MLKKLLIGFIVFELCLTLALAILVSNRYGDLEETQNRVALLYDMQKCYEMSHGLSQEFCGAIFLIAAHSVRASQATPELLDTFVDIYLNDPYLYLQVNEICPFDGSDDSRIGCQLLRYVRGR